MAEPDAAGPGTPGGPDSRALTREDIERRLAEDAREWEALSPEERARREAESEKLDREAAESIRASVESFEAIQRAARPTVEAIERAAGAADRYLASAPDRPPWCPGEPPRGIVEDPAERGRKLAEILATIEPARPLRTEDVRRAVADGVKEGLTEAAGRPAPDSGPSATTPPPGMFTGGAAWTAGGMTALAVARVLRQLDGLPVDPPNEPPAKAPTPPPASVDEIKAAAKAGAEEGTKKALAESKKDRKPRGDTTCERMRDLHANIDPEFAETVSERELGERIDRKPGTFPSSHYWRTVLKPKRREVRAAIQEGKKKLREAQRWGDFNSVGHPDEDSKGH